MKTTIRNVGCLAIIAGFMVASSSCTKKGGGNTPPPVDSFMIKYGYDSASQIEPASLVAHWNFNGSDNETISGTAPITSSNASFVNGIEGQALNLNNGYILYPTIAALSSSNAIPSVTVSAWIKVDNNGKTASSFFALTQPTTVQADWGGIINMYAETAHPVSYDDTLVLHGAIGTYPAGTRLGADNINDYGVRGTDFKTVLGTNKWVHYVLRYNGDSSDIDLFANGVLVSNTKFSHRLVGTTPLGPIVCPTPTQVLIGGWPNAATGYSHSSIQTWQGMLTGSIDELRVYNIALSDSEINALYHLELVGR